MTKKKIQLISTHFVYKINSSDGRQISNSESFGKISKRSILFIVFLFILHTFNSLFYWNRIICKIEYSSYQLKNTITILIQLCVRIFMRVSPIVLIAAIPYFVTREQVYSILFWFIIIINGIIIIVGKSIVFIAIVLILNILKSLLNLNKLLFEVIEAVSQLKKPLSFYFGHVLALLCEYHP